MNRTDAWERELIYTTAPLGSFVWRSLCCIEEACWVSTTRRAEAIL